MPSQVARRAGTDPDELNDMADEGGTALQGQRRYYQADDAASLATPSIRSPSPHSA